MPAQRCSFIGSHSNICRASVAQSLLVRTLCMQRWTVNLSCSTSTGVIEATNDTVIRALSATLVRDVFSCHPASSNRPCGWAVSSKFLVYGKRQKWQPKMESFPLNQIKTKRSRGKSHPTLNLKANGQARLVALIRSSSHGKRRQLFSRPL